MFTVIPTDLPGNIHYTDSANPARVIRAERYRLSWAAVVEHTSGQFAGLAGVFREEYRPAGTFGVAGLESQEYSALWIGAPEIITRFTNDPRHVVPWDAFNTSGGYTDRWPNTDAWVDFIPPTTWCPGGQGIVTELPHDSGDGAVVVYELLAVPALLSPGTTDRQGLVPVVTYHCTRCHHAGDNFDRYTSHGPDDRRAIGQKARQHMRCCEGAEATAAGDRMIAAVQSAVGGKPAPSDITGLYAAHCATADLRPGEHGHPSSCAEVRQARTSTACRA